MTTAAHSTQTTTVTVTVHQLGSGWAWSGVVPLIALAFTIASFWWLYARRGRLVSTSTPHGYAVVATPGLFLLRIPITLRNTGATAIVVRNLRMWFEDIPHALEISWRRTMKHLQPWGDDFLEVSAPFVVGGRESHVVVAEFGSPLPGFTLAPGTHRVLVQIDDDGRHRGTWRDLMRFELHVPGPPADLSSYLLHWNRRDDPLSAQRATGGLTELLGLIADLATPEPHAHRPPGEDDGTEDEPPPGGP